MTSQWQLAQINVARALHSLEDERMAEFVAQLDRINALAEQSPGFVWRLQTDDGNATAVRVAEDPQIIVNMSVWVDVESLFQFAYKSAHRGVFADRRRWFEKPADAYQALWWVPAGHQPTADEGMRRLHLLRREGPGPAVFTFTKRFDPPAD